MSTRPRRRATIMDKPFLYDCYYVENGRYYRTEGVG